MIWRSKWSVLVLAKKLELLWNYTKLPREKNITAALYRGWISSEEDLYLARDPLNGRVQLSQTKKCPLGLKQALF